MTRKTRNEQLLKLLAVLLIAFALKHFYSTASVNELRWILTPTTFLVELVSGRTFFFEMHAGYMSSDRSFLIATSCAGVNFMIAAFLMLSLAKLWRRELSWKLLPAALAVSYVATIVANTVRISTALHLQNRGFDIASLSANQLHRLEGILIYFGFLLLLYWVSERATDQSDFSRKNGRVVNAARFVFPLFIYYAATLAMPLVTSIYRQDFADTAFLEHSVFVLLAPLAVVAPLTLIRTKFR